MISIEENKMIDQLLVSDNRHHIMCEFISRYIRDSKDSYDVMRITATVTDRQMTIMKNMIIEYNAAVDMLIGERYTKKKRKKQSEDDKFISMMYVCKAMFPDGYPEQGSPVKKDYYREFKRIVDEREMGEKEREWLKMMGNLKYVELVKKETIEEV